MPMRTGKTRVAVRYIRWRRPSRVLIVAPLSALYVWERELKLQEIDAQIMLLNFEQTYWREPFGDGYRMVDNEEMLNFAPQLVVVDEAHRVGDPGTLANKKLYQLIKRHDPEVVQLTGTPWERGILKVFGMEKLYDDTNFGTAFGPFKRTYAVFGGYGGYKLLRYRNTRRLRKKIAPHAFLMDHVPSRPPVDCVVKFDLEESAGLYRKVADDGFATLGRNSSLVVDCDNPLVRTLRCSQITGGAVKAKRGESEVAVRVGREKQRAFDDWLSGADGVDKLVVGCRFLFELRDASKVLQKHGYRVLLMHGGTKRSERERRITCFNDLDERVAFVCQISTGKEGIDLSAADTLVYYSLTRSLVEFLQFGARIRKFKDTRALTYVFFLARGTIDEVALLAFRKNLEVIDLLKKHPDWIHYRRAEG